jgi:transposase
MQDKDLYAQILGVQAPWQVRAVALDLPVGEVVIHVQHDPQVPLCCPECGATVPGYDAKERRWRHLDTCQYRTILACQVPRCNCPDHGVHQVSVPWGEPGGRFTALFEALAIDWLKTTSTSAVAKNLGLTWDQLDGIMQRAVRRGLERREAAYPAALGVDETSFKRRHEYVTVVQDQQSGHVLHVADGRGRAALDEFFEGLDDQQLGGIESVAMDMHQPYIQSTLEHVPNAEQKIAFDKFHVAKHLGDAVDKVRRHEHRDLLEIQDETLKGTKYLWLRNPEKMGSGAWAALSELRDRALRTARAWALKETAMTLWHYSRRGWALRAWNSWLAWAQRCRLEPMVRAARTVRRHLWGIINAIVLKVTNAGAESLNAKIQRLKKWACGYRNRERFKAAIMFHLGGLDLYPAGVNRS